MRKLKDINWNQVYYFYEVARKMSMKEAAEVTGVSIPTVSEQIKRLETLLETPLFHRRPRRLELTTEGEVLFRFASQMFEAGLRFLDVVSPTVIGGYPVRIGVQESFAGHSAMDFLQRYFDAFSPFGTVQTERETGSERLLERIAQGGIDWGLTLTQPASPRLEYGRVAMPEVMFFIAKETNEKHVTKAELFENVPLARSPYDEQLNKLVMDHLQGEDIFPEEIIDSEHWEFCQRLLLQGKCVMALSSGSMAEAVEAGRLQRFALGRPMVLTYYAVWPQSSNRMIAIRKLIELLEKENKGVRPRAGESASASVPSTGPCASDPRVARASAVFDQDVIAV